MVVGLVGVHMGARRPGCGAVWRARDARDARHWEAVPYALFINVFQVIRTDPSATPTV